MEQRLKAVKLKILLAVLLIIAIVTGIYIFSQDSTSQSSAPPQISWFESSSTGKLTQELSYFAVSARTAPKLRMAYPYNQLTATIGFGCDKSEQWMYVAFSEPPNFANTETEEELHRFVTKIMFDEQSAKYEATQAFGSRFIHFREDALVLENLLQANHMVFEVDWHREGFVQFQFPLSGSADIIKKTQSKCENS